MSHACNRSESATLPCTGKQDVVPEMAVGTELFHMYKNLNQGLVLAD